MERANREHETSYSGGRSRLPTATATATALPYAAEDGSVRRERLRRRRTRSRAHGTHVAEQRARGEHLVQSHQTCAMCMRASQQSLRSYIYVR